MSGRTPARFLGRLAGKSALVTGAGTAGGGLGTGKAIAVLFAAEGARVCLVDRDSSAARDTLAQIESLGGNATVSVGDVCSAADCARVVAECNERAGGLDILVNNVGITGARARPGETDMDEWQRVLDVNLKSAVLMSNSSAPFIARSGRGVILNIASIAGLLAYGSSAYGPSKAAMIALTREQALIHGRNGIRANAIAPGHIDTPMASGAVGEGARAARRRAGPLGLQGDAWDIAYAALFLAGDEARFITGICLPVDGGVTVIGSLAAAPFARTAGECELEHG